MEFDKITVGFCYVIPSYRRVIDIVCNLWFFYMFQTIHELQALLQEKLDCASHDLLLKASALADAETSNLQKVISNIVITLCMWGNLSKNPRWVYS